MRRAVHVGFCWLLLCPSIVWSAETVERALTASEAIRLAVERSGDLMRNRQLLAAAARRRELGLREYFPQAEVTAGNSDTVAISGSDSQSRQVSISVTQPVYRGGRVSAQRNLQAIDLTLRQQQLTSAERELANQVYEAYYTLVITNQRIALQAEALQRTRSQLTVAETEYDLGQIREIDLLETQLAVSDQEIALQEEQTRRRDLRFGLRKLLSLEPKETLTLTERLDDSYRGIASFHPVAFYAQIARERNLTLKQQQVEIRRQIEELRIARNNFIPDVSLEARVSMSAESLPLQNPEGSVTLRLSFPSQAFPIKTDISLSESANDQRTRNLSTSTGVASTLTYRVDRDEQRVRLDAATSEREATQEQLVFNVEQGIRRYREARERLSLLRDRLKLEERKLLIVERQRETGDATRLSLLEQQQRVLSQQLTLLEEVLSLVLAEREIENLIGVEPGRLRSLSERSRE